MLAVLHMQAAGITQLRTHGYVCPIGLDQGQMLFSWVIDAEARGTMQTAYCITVATDADLTHRVWESGWVNSSQSVDVEAQGFRPQPTTRYYWQVRVCDNHGAEMTSKEKAYFETGLMSESQWQGSEWIRATKSGGTVAIGAVPMLRHEFTLPKPIAWARLYSSALGIYNAFINGQRVGIIDDDGRRIQDELKPGWTDYTKRVFYLTHDVTPLLRQGRNAIGAELSSGWWNGAIARGRNGSQPQLGFRAVLVVRYTDGSEERITSNLHWKSSTDGPLQLGDIYAGETYDARKQCDWTSPGFDDSAWSAVALNTDFHGILSAYEGPPVYVVPELERPLRSATLYEGTRSNGTTYGALVKKASYSQQQQAITLKAGQTLVYDFGQNGTGWVNFRAEGAKGTTLTIRFAEMLNETGDKARGEDGPAGSAYFANLRTAKATLTYTLRGDTGGESYHPTATYFGFRYVQVTATRPVTILAMRAETLTSVMHQDAHLSTNSPAVNQLVSNIRWGQYSNFLSVPMDCPQRDERLGWTADAQVFSVTSMYNADTRNFFRKWLQDLRDSQPADGAYTRVAPFTSGGNAGAAGWAEAAVIVPWNIYLMTGDKSAMREMWEANERYMDWLSTQKGDGFSYNGGSTAYADWVAFAETDKRYVSVCYYANTAALMAKMGEALSQQPGDVFSQKAAKYRTLFTSIQNEFTKRFLKPIVGVSSIDTQTAYLLPLRFGLFRTAAIAKRNSDALLKNIQANGNKLTTGFLGTSVLCQTLSENGLSDVAYSLLLQHECPSWLYSVDQGATTIWERWNSYSKEGGFNPDQMNSFNHFAYGCVGEWMYRYMAGIAPDEQQPGFRHIVLQPTLDRHEGTERITEVSASTWTAYGTIRCSWQDRGKGRLTYNVTVPANTTATLHLPVADGMMVAESGRLADQCDDIRFEERCADCNVYTIGSGSYRFVVDEPAIIEDAVRMVGANFESSHLGTYDLQGRPAQAEPKGIFIRDGKKQVRR